MKKQNKLSRLVRGAMIGAIYVVLTFISNTFGLASGAIQVRLSEALCVLPVLFPEAIGGLTVGCFLANLLTGCVPLDILFGSVATLLGAIGTYKLRKHPVLIFFPPVLANMLIVPFVLRYAYGLGEAWWYMVLTVGAGEIVSCVIIGRIFLQITKKYKL